MRYIFFVIFLTFALYPDNLNEKLLKHFDGNISSVKDFCIKNRYIFKNKKGKSNGYEVFVRIKFNNGRFVASFDGKKVSYIGYFTKDGKLIKGGEVTAYDDPVGKWCYFKNTELTWIDYSADYKFGFNDAKKMVLKLLIDDKNTTFQLTKDIVSDKKLWKVYNIGIYCFTLYINGADGQIEKVDFYGNDRYNIKFKNCIKNKKYTIKKCFEKSYPSKYPFPICLHEPIIPPVNLGFEYDREYGKYSITENKYKQ